MEIDFTKLRHELVDQKIKRRGGIKDPATLAAMRTVPRHEFVPPQIQAMAYLDSPLPIGEGQTISQPYIVALMTQLAELEPDSIVLDIGTGSGYAAAILSRIAQKIYTIERLPMLTENAQTIFKKLGYSNIECKVGDGTIGWKEKGPFDAIIVTAGAPVIPETLLMQLKIGGRLIIPVGDAFSQELFRIRNLGEDKHSREIIEAVRFVPLIGEEGWKT
jgi:protein-L-isoaspartate(D-aspartate) O-methyltransferase